MTTHFYDHQKKDIATAAVALLAACKWDMEAARTALGALAPIAALPARNEKGEPVTMSSAPIVFTAETAKMFAMAYLGVAGGSPHAEVIESGIQAGLAAVGALPETFNVMLTAVGRDKIAVIKAIRGITGLGLKEAKYLVEAAPKLVKRGMSKGAAEEVAKVLAANGAGVTVEMVAP